MIEERTQSTKKPRLIYLVDDDEEDVVFFQLAVKTCFPHDVVRFFHSGPELLMELTQPGANVPDVIFINSTMPIMDGVQTLLALRQLPVPELSLVPKIFLSGVFQEKRMEEAQQAGAVACLVKPHSVGELVKLLVEIQTAWMKTG